MVTYLYKDFAIDLSKRFKLELEAVSAEFNFELGDEFEIALCDILRRVLPAKYGICRGHVVSAEGETAGDDIIIYDQNRLPTLKLRRKNDYSRLENIPVEAVYCYIEAKHTLFLGGDVHKDKQSLSHAWEQVRRVKTVISKRESVPIDKIAPYRSLPDVRWNISDYHPGIQNPAFGVVLCRHFRLKPKGEILDHPQSFKNAIENWEIPSCGPDFVGLGPNMFITPCVATDEGNLYIPFRLPNRSKYHVLETRDMAFGVSLLAILSAIDVIQLGVMPWTHMLNDVIEHARSTT